MVDMKIKTDRRFISRQWELTKFGSKKRGSKCYNIQQIKIMIYHFIKECYFTVGILLLLQFIGIPMWTNTAPFGAVFYPFDNEAGFI